MPRLGAEQAANQRHRATLRGSSGGGRSGDEFSPNLLHQIAAAEARAAVEAQAQGAKRQYIRKSSGGGGGGRRGGTLGRGGAAAGGGPLPPIRPRGPPAAPSSAVATSLGSLHTVATTKGPRQKQSGPRQQQRPGDGDGNGGSDQPGLEGQPRGARKPAPVRKREGGRNRLDLIGVNDRFVEAAGEARVDFVIQRIQDGQDLDHVHTLLGYTALHAAADMAGARGGVNLGQLEIVYLLLQAGCRLNIQARSNGETALHRAAANGRFKVVELLVNYGAKTLIKDREGQIALQRANMYNRPRCAMLLRAFPAVCRRVRVVAVAPRRLELRWDPPRNFRQLACPVDAYKMRWREVTPEYVQSFAAIQIQKFFGRYVQKRPTLLLGSAVHALFKNANVLLTGQLGPWTSTASIPAPHVPAAADDGAAVDADSAHGGAMVSSPSSPALSSADGDDGDDDGVDGSGTDSDGESGGGGSDDDSDGGHGAVGSGDASGTAEGSSMALVAVERAGGGGGGGWVGEAGAFSMERQQQVRLQQQQQQQQRQKQQQQQQREYRSSPPPSRGQSKKNTKKPRRRGLARFRATGVLGAADTQERAKTDWRWTKGLLPAAAYAVQVQAHNDRGWGKFTTELHVCTADAAPDAPEAVRPRVALATELEMEFTAPRANCNPSEIHHYEVQRKALDSLSHLVQQELHQWVACRDDVPGQGELCASRMRVRSLTPSTTYVFRLRAVTQPRLGPGPWSAESPPFRTKDAPYLEAATCDSITVRWAAPEGDVDVAAYHLQKSLVSENELDEGPWEPAVAPEDDELTAVAARLAATGVELKEGVDDDENGLDDGAPTVVTTERYTVRGLLSCRQYKFRVKFLSAADGTWSRFDPKDQSAWIATTAHVPEPPAPPHLCQDPHLFLPDPGTGTGTGVVTGAHRTLSLLDAPPGVPADDVPAALAMALAAAGTGTGRAGRARALTAGRVAAGGGGGGGGGGGSGGYGGGVGGGSGGGGLSAVGPRRVLLQGTLPHDRGSLVTDCDLEVHCLGRFTVEDMLLMRDGRQFERNLGGAGSSGGATTATRSRGSAGGAGGGEGSGRGGGAAVGDHDSLLLLDRQHKAGLVFGRFVKAAVDDSVGFDFPDDGRHRDGGSSDSDSDSDGGSDGGSGGGGGGDGSAAEGGPGGRGGDAGQPSTALVAVGDGGRNGSSSSGGGGAGGSDGRGEALGGGGRMFAAHRGLGVALFRVGALQPGVRAVFRVRYRNKRGWSRWSRSSCPVDTAPDVPDAPAPPAARADVAAFLHLSLAAPHHNGALVRRVQVQRRQAHVGRLWDEDGAWEVDQVLERRPGWRRGEHIALDVGPLRAGSAWQFRARAYNLCGWGAFSAPAPPVQTHCAAPARCLPVVLQAATTCTHTLAWEPCCDHGAAVDVYEVERRIVHIPDGGVRVYPDMTGAAARAWHAAAVVNHNTQKGQFSVTLSGLIPGASWVYRIRAHNAEGWGPHSEASAAFQTLPDVPSAPGLPDAVDVTSFNVTLLWPPPCDHGERVLSHLLEMAPVVPPAEPRGLTAYDGDRRDGASSGGGDWPGQGRGALEDGPGDGPNHGEVRRPPSPPLAWMEVSRLLPEPTRYLQGLEPGETYVFRARARNGLGWGPFCAPTAPVTLQPAAPMRPAAPVRMDFQPRCIELRWLAPKDNGAAVRRYELLLYRTFIEKLPDGQIVMKDPPPEHPGIFKQWVVPEVQGAPGTAAAIPRLEDGHDGDDGGADADDEGDTATYLGTIDEDTYGAIVAADGDVVGGGGDDSYYVGDSVAGDTYSYGDDNTYDGEDGYASLDGGSGGGGGGAGTAAGASSYGGASMATPVPPPARSLLLFDTTTAIKVRPMSRYQFKLRAWNAAGWSEWSPASEPMVTQAGNPDPPPRPLLHFHTDSIIHVKWGSANPCGSPVDGYELQQREIRASDATGAGRGEAAAWRAAPWVTVGANFTECEYINCDLSSVFIYKFRVRAHNYEGWSLWGRESAAMRTKRRF